MRRDLSLFFAGAMVVLFIACSTDRTDPTDPFGGIPEQLTPLLEAAGPGLQSFTINNDRDTVLFGERGTVVTIPAGAFEEASGPISVRLIEAPDISDLLLLNAPTVSRGRMLVTDGVVHLSALANGRPLEVKKGMSLELEVPTTQLDPEMDAFVGRYDEDGRMTWVRGNTLVNEGKEEVRTELAHAFLQIPMDLFPNRARYFRMDSIARAHTWTNGELHAPTSDLLIGRERAAFYGDAVRFLTDPASQATPLATREFAQRLADLEYYYYYWYYDEPDGARLHYDVFGPFQHRIFQVYLQNMDQELWRCDSLAVEVMKEWVPRNKRDSTEREKYGTSLERFTQYRDERLTRPVKISDHGVDLDAPDAYAQLLGKGVEKSEARRLVELNGLRSAAIAELRRERARLSEAIALEDERIAEEKQVRAARYYLLSVNKLGWINVDRFYDDPTARECEVIADVPMPAGLDQVQVSLVLHGMRSVIDGIRGADGRYHFTKEDEYYRRLPMDQEATMVAIGYKDGKPWLAKRRIVIKEKVSEKLEPMAMDMEAFKASLDELN